MKQMKKSVQGNIQIIQTFYSIVCQASAAKKSGRKRNSILIPVQPTAISRRVAKHRGRVKAPRGRKPKDQQQRTQFVITDDCNIAKSLPSQKKSKSKQRHSLAVNRIVRVTTLIVTTLIVTEVFPTT